MGAGIAQVTIDKGMTCVLKDMNIQGLSRGEEQIQKNLKTMVKKRRLTQFEADRVYSNLKPTITYDGFDKVRSRLPFLRQFPSSPSLRPFRWIL